jgi:hypothetical protein
LFHRGYFMVTREVSTLDYCCRESGHHRYLCPRVPRQPQAPSAVGSAPQFRCQFYSSPPTGILVSHAGQSQYCLLPVMPDQVSTISGSPQCLHDGPPRTRCLATPTSFRAPVFAVSCAKACRMLSNSFSLPQCLHTPLLVAPSGGAITQ